MRELAAAAGQRQEAVAARLARLGAVADTLAERSSLLAGLHWSLPRPASAAEQQMDKQLEVSDKLQICHACFAWYLPIAQRGTVDEI
jgi:ABC-type transporter Mla subunit MlaD